MEVWGIMSTNCKEEMLKGGICMFTNKSCSDYPYCDWKVPRVFPPKRGSP